MFKKTISIVLIFLILSFTTTGYSYSQEINKEISNCNSSYIDLRNFREDNFYTNNFYTRSKEKFSDDKDSADKPIISGLTASNFQSISLIVIILLLVVILIQINKPKENKEE